MKSSILLLALLVSLALAHPAHATTISCVPPTKNADGSAFAAGVVISFNVYSGPSASALTLITPTPLASCSDVLQATSAPGTCFAIAAVETIGTSVAIGAQTVPVCMPPAAGTPTISLASTSTIAYMLVPGVNTYGALIIGSAPLGTPCDATKPLLTYFPIPTSAVTFTGSIKSPVVVTTCQ